MENKAIRRAFLPILSTFIIFSLLILVFRPFPEAWKTDYRVLLGGNGLLFVVTALSLYLYVKGLRDSNAHFFVRMMYGSLLVKMLVCLLAVLIYAMFAGKGINRNGVIGCFILYLLYTYLEVRILRKNV
ncbi:MAG TPA: hypothetical protein VNU72_04780 [Puia sp.]|jgi:hypothetical protein|nr:hypothetical protein [Puia sp.]